MTQRASESLVAALIRIGLLLALAIMLMAENAQAQALHVIHGRATLQACSCDSLQALEPTLRRRTRCPVDEQGDL